MLITQIHLPTLMHRVNISVSSTLMVNIFSPFFLNYLMQFLILEAIPSEIFNYVITRVCYSSWPSTNIFIYFNLYFFDALLHGTSKKP